MRRDHSGAIDNYREILENTAEPDKERAHFDLARAYERKQDRDAIPEAMLHYNAATTVERPNPGALLRLGILYQKQDRQKAGETFDMAQKVYEDKDYQEGSIEVILQRGILYRDLGNAVDVLAQLEQAYDLAKAIGNKNQQVRALLPISRLLNDQQKLDSAKERADLARKIAQDAEAQELSTEALIDSATSFGISANMTRLWDS